METRPCARSIWAVRSMQPHPTSLVKFEGSIFGKSVLYENQNRD